MRRLLVFVLLLLPTPAFAQASLTGTVRDASGAVLPGVTVEAASPALIEKVRTAVTDDSGQYRIIDLRPGTYALTFTLPGFSTVKREGIELTGSATLAIPVGMRVGGLEETITVSGEAPVVDVQNARREVVMQSAVIEALPLTRAVGALLNATPGVTVDNNSVALSPTMTFFAANGGTNGEGRMMVSGMVVATARGGAVSSYVYDAVGVDEVAVTVGGGLGESDSGGPVMNLIPRSGGDTFAGSAFTNLAGDWSRGDNLDDELRAVGLTQTPGILHAHDASVSLGGPILRQRLWFYGSYRRLSTQTAVEGVTANANAFDPSRWDWAPSEINARLVQDRQMAIARFSGQAGRSRIQVNYEYQKRCEGTPLRVETEGCHNRGADWVGLGTTTQSPEATGTAARGYFDWPFHLTQGSWTMPANNKLLLDAGVTLFRFYPAFGYPPPDGITTLIPVTEQSNAINTATGQRFAPQPNYTYRGLGQWGFADSSTRSFRSNISYVTGSHSMKVGYETNWLQQLDNTIAASDQVAYRFNLGVPNAVTYRLPEWSRNSITQGHGFFVQDSFTRGRLTAAGAVRYDRVSSYAPVEGNGVSMSSRFNAAPITVQETPGVDAYNDITPRVGIAYDVFGTAKTALKFRWGRYLAVASSRDAYTATNPAATLVATVTNRAWTDNNRDLVVDCDLLSPSAQGPATGSVDGCGAVTGNSQNFGRVGAATAVDPEILAGWKVRPHDYQTEVTIQQQLLPRVSAEFSYIRRTFHGFLVTQDINRNMAADYAEYTLTAPTDPRLPGGGGYAIPVAVLTSTGPSQNFLTRESRYSNDGAERDAYYDGFNFNVNARMRNGLLMQFGTQTGRRNEDRCGIMPNLTDNQGNARGCESIEPWQTTVRGLASYTVPKVDVLVSATFRSQPGAELTGAWRVPNSVIQGALGFLPPGALPNGNTTIQLFDDTNRLYADFRRNQIDMRVAKVLRFGRTRTDIGLDLNNLLNTNYATGFNQTYVHGAAGGGGWNNPTSVYTPRFMRLNITISY